MGSSGRVSGDWFSIRKGDLKMSGRRLLEGLLITLRLVVFAVAVIYLVSKSFFGAPIFWICVLVIGAATHIYIMVRRERPIDFAVRAISRARRSRFYLRLAYG